MTQRLKLEHVDYRVEGFYSGKEVDLGVEFKRGDDMANSYTLLNNRLALAMEDHINVGLIVHHNHDSIMDMDYGTHEKAVYKYIVTNELTLSMNYTAMQNTLRSFERCGVLTGQVMDYWEIPRMMVSMLNWCTKDDHKGLLLDKEQPDAELRNILMRVPGIGPTTAHKLSDKYSSIGDIMRSTDIDTCIGPKTGKKLLDYLWGDNR